MNLIETLTRLGVARPASKEPVTDPSDLAVADDTPRRIRRRTARRRLNAIVTALLVVATVMALFPTWARADEGFWKQTTTRVSDSREGATEYEYHWFERVDGGTVNDLYETTGNEVYRHVGTAVPGSEAAMSSLSGKDNAPKDGRDWDNRTSESFDGGSETRTSDSILGAWDPDAKAFKNAAPPDPLREPFNSMIYFLASAVGSTTMVVLDLCASLLTLVDVNSLLLSDFGTNGGTFTRFYQQTNSVVSKIATPLGTAFMTLAFVLYLIKLTDTRRYGGQAWFEALMRTVAFYLAATVLVAHSLELSGTIYWAAKQTAWAVNKALTTTTHGGTSSLAALGMNLENSLGEQLATVTYDDWSALLPACLVIFVCMKQIITFSVTVFTTCFMRMIEIYLRAAFMPIPLSFLVNDDMRQIGVTYLKRFAGCCFMACVFIGALGLTNALADTVFGVFDAATAGMTGVAGLLSVAAPVVITLSSLDAVISKSNDIANSLFGI